ncbi:hypothetical protein [Agromyces aureus]|uniref:Uncharacterized protein n=1 Tax=Agromyces aureus TaxID=453304 RepID=A0A191WCE5_9MICO|nr:hypothetical protein [Agromyces aureus]ANJ25907.1 hypothetical protein ATC03_03275 [Agromyces aureus]
MGDRHSARHRSRPTGRPRLRVLRAALAALVVTGAGAALTLAAWTDGAFFTTTVSSGTVDLEGAVDFLDPLNPGTVPDGLDWREYPGPDAANSGEVKRFVPPAIDFLNLGPGESRSATTWVRNAGSLPIALQFDPADPASVSWTGADPFPDPPEVTVSATDLNGSPLPALDGWVLRAGDWLTLTVTVATPADWDQANAGRSAGLQLAFRATTDGAD